MKKITTYTCCMLLSLLPSLVTAKPDLKFLKTASPDSVFPVILFPEDDSKGVGFAYLPNRSFNAFCAVELGKYANAKLAVKGKGEPIIISFNSQGTALIRGVFPDDGTLFVGIEREGHRDNELLKANCQIQIEAP